MKMSSVSFSKFAFFGFILTGLSSCGRDPDLLYYRNPPPRETLYQEAQVRELINDGAVDILFVVDNSGSMGTHQNRLIQSTNDFMDEFLMRGSTFKYQIGVISSDETQGPFAGFTPGTKIDPSSTNPKVRFVNAIRALGTNGSGDEKFFKPMLNHLSRGTFLRKRAYFAVFFMTDAPEQSTGLTAATTFNQLTTLVGDSNRIFVYGAFASNDTSGCSNEGWSWTGPGDDIKWKQFFDFRKGTRYDLCQNQLGQQMASFAKDLVVKVDNPKIQLKDRPLPSTIRIYYEGSEVPGGSYKDPKTIWFYDYQLNAIVFKTLDLFPVDTSKVEIIYEVDDGRPELE